MVSRSTAFASATAAIVLVLFITLSTAPAATNAAAVARETSRLVGRQLLKDVVYVKVEKPKNPCDDCDCKKCSCTKDDECYDCCKDSDSCPQKVIQYVVVEKAPAPTPPPAPKKEEKKTVTVDLGSKFAIPKFGFGFKKSIGKKL